MTLSIVNNQFISGIEKINFSLEGYACFITMIINSQNLI